MKVQNLPLVGILFLVGFSTANAQYNYVSNDNTSYAPGDWHSGSTWTITNGPSPLPTPSDNFNPVNTHSQLGNVGIYGYTYINSDLQVGNANPTIDVYDTLFITGNVRLHSTRLTIHPNGLLIVKGNLTLENGSFDLTNNGTVVVTGNVSVSNGAITNNNDFYLYGNASVSNGGGIDGCYAWVSGCNPASTMNSESDLQNDDPDLYAFVASGNVILPVQLLFFSGEALSNSIVLTWATAEEENFDYFTVERSQDGNTFESIGRIYGAGTHTKVRKDYQFPDNAPHEGTSYYRLKATDYDGTVEYFKPVYVNFEPENVLASLYPNPGNGEFLTISLSNAEQQNAEFQLYTLSGKRLFDQALNLSTNTIEFNRQLDKGVYLAVIKTGFETQSFKWIVR